MKKIHLLKLSGCSIYRQLQIEEALLRADERNWCILGEGSPPAIVLGISSKTEQWIESNPPIPVIRRFSGGGTVVVDEETLFVTLICNEKDAGIESFPERVLHWNSALFEPLLAPYGFLAKENDYTLSGKKFGGNAQYFCKNRWLHHSTLLWNYRPELMSLLKHPPRMPKYREDRPHEEFLCRLQDVLTEKDTLPLSLLASLSKKFDIHEVREEELLPILDRPHRNSTKMLDLSVECTR